MEIIPIDNSIKMPFFTPFTVWISLIYSLSLIYAASAFAQVDTTGVTAPPPPAAPSTHLENLGPLVNSSHAESAPVISPDGNTIYYWSIRPNGQGFQDIYIAHRDTNSGQWLNPIHPGFPLNDSRPNIVLSITPDGRKLLVYKDDKKAKAKGFSDLAIYKKYYDSWTVQTFLKFDQYENLGESSITAYLGADGKTIMLSKEGSDALGNEDLYIAFYTDSTKTWSKPMNIGNINTPNHEITPFLASDGITLYFSSDRPGGLGGYDVYMTQRLDPTWKNWSPAKNLGNMVNTPGDDVHFKFPTAADVAYLVSTYPADTNYGMKDIYTMLLPNEFKPHPVTMVVGKVRNKVNNNPMGAHITYVKLPSGENMGTATADSTTGDYTIILPTGYNYAVTAEGTGFIAVSENINVSGEMAFNRMQRDLYLVPIEIGGIVRLNNLFFATASAVLDPNSTPELERLILLMNKYPTMVLEIGGHTDNIGDPTTNLRLSDLRAKSVVEFLVSRGINKERMIPKGYGMTMPSVSNDTVDARAINRRVEIKIVSL
jgi:OmpA-OmpF porin, OOP family